MRLHRGRLLAGKFTVVPILTKKVARCISSKAFLVVCILTKKLQEISVVKISLLVCILTKKVARSIISTYIGFYSSVYFDEKSGKKYQC